MSHALTPWRRDGNGWIVDAVGGQVFRSDPVRSSDVSFILRAVNSHDELLTCLKEVVGLLERVESETGMTPNAYARDRMARYRAAIAAALPKAVTP